MIAEAGGSYNDLSSDEKRHYENLSDAYDEIDDLVYAKIRGMEKEVVPGSQDYELLYEKFYQEELSKRGML